MYEFLGNDHIIQSHSSWNKSCLEGGDEFGQHGSESLDYDLSDHFVHCIAYCMGLSLVMHPISLVIL